MQLQSLTWLRKTVLDIFNRNTFKLIYLLGMSIFYGKNKATLTLKIVA